MGMGSLLSGNCEQVFFLTSFPATSPLATTKGPPDPPPNGRETWPRPSCDSRRVNAAEPAVWEDDDGVTRLAEVEKGSIVHL